MDEDTSNQPIAAQGADKLTSKSRDFYESTKVKVLFSICFGALALMCLGFTATIGGRAAAARTMAKKVEASGDDAIYNVQVNGFGFSTFCQFTAFTLCLTAAFLISPFIHGTKKETELLKNPQELEFQAARPF